MLEQGNPPPKYGLDKRHLPVRAFIFFPFEMTFSFRSKKGDC